MEATSGKRGGAASSSSAVRDMDIELRDGSDGSDGSDSAPAAEAAATAASLGMAYSHLPFSGYGFDEALVREHQAALAAQPGPAVAHCRSGTRSLTIWTIGEVLDGRMAIEDVDAFGQRHGFDLSGVHRWFGNRK